MFLFSSSGEGMNGSAASHEQRLSLGDTGGFLQKTWTKRSDSAALTECVSKLKQNLKNCVPCASYCAAHLVLVSKSILFSWLKSQTDPTSTHEVGNAKLQSSKAKIRIETRDLRLRR